jgi:N-acetylmuramoyl-L-alanine amidase
MRNFLRNSLTFNTVVFILVFCLSARQTLNAADPASALTVNSHSLAEDLFIRANDLNTTLHTRPLEERNANDYLRTLDLYSQVIRLNTDNRFSAESLSKRAELLREMADVKGDSALYQQAIAAFRQIITEHPHSVLVGSALINIAEIYEENLQDLDGAIAAYKELSDYFPASVMAREARAVIARFESQLANRSADVIVANHKTAVEAAAHLAELTNVRNFSSADYARVVIDLSNNAEFTPTRIGENKIAIKLSNSIIAQSLFGRRFIVGNSNLLKRITVYEGESASSGVQIELEISEAADFSTFKLTEPERIVVDIHAAKELAKSHTTVETVKETPVVEDVTTPITRTNETVTASKPADTVTTGKPIDSTMNPAPPKLEGSNTIARVNKPATSGKQPVMALPEITEPIVPHNPNEAANAKPNAEGQAAAIGAAVDAKVASGSAIKCVVIDAGHGGHDTGTISPNGLREKDLTLDVARRLKAYIKRTYADIDVVMTRDGDYFVALEQRTAIANARHADLFISVHANSSPAKAASGVETYFVNPDKAKARAEQEQAAQLSEAKPAVAKAEDTITASVAVANRVAESRELARYIQSGLVRGIGAASPSSAANRGVKHAGFVVLMGAAMPSVLAEVSFLSNPKDEALLMTGQFRERIAASLFAGLNGYLKKNRNSPAK